MRKRIITDRAGKRLNCEKTAAFLFDYACHTGELDWKSREDTRKHLAECPACRATAKDMKAVAALLRKASKAYPARLSAGHRRRILESLGQS